MIAEDYAATTARYYDCAYSAKDEDVNFWAGVELGCGTGRVALETARPVVAASRHSWRLVFV